MSTRKLFRIYHIDIFCNETLWEISIQWTIRIYFCELTKKLNIKARLIDSIVFISNKNSDIQTLSWIFFYFAFCIFFFTSWDTQPPFFVLGHFRSIVHIIAETCAWVRCHFPRWPLSIWKKYNRQKRTTLSD